MFSRTIPKAKDDPRGCGEAIMEILEHQYHEGLRLRMVSWIRRRGGLAILGFEPKKEMIKDACETACCIAGSMALHDKGVQSIASYSSIITGGHEMEFGDYALRKLSGGDEDPGGLVYPDAWPDRARDTYLNIRDWVLPADVDAAKYVLAVYAVRVFFDRSFQTILEIPEIFLQLEKDIWGTEKVIDLFEGEYNREDAFLLEANYGS